MGAVTGIMAAAVAALFGLMLSVRFMRRQGERRPAAQEEPAFDQSEMYAMLNTGQVTPAEFERLQVLVLAQRKRAPGAGPVIPRGPRGFEPVLRPGGRPPRDGGNPSAGR